MPLICSHTSTTVAPAGSEDHGRAEQFTRGRLSRSDLHPTDPIAQFHAWYKHAQHATKAPVPSSSAGEGAPAAEPQRLVPHPETCVLSTAHLPSGRVSSRTVYLKELDAQAAGSSGGFVIYTNMGTSRKAADVATNPRAALVFWWEALERQVRVEGACERLTRDESQAYYDTRVRGSRIGAWASRQSTVLEPEQGSSASGGNAVEADDGRRQLERWVEEEEERWKDVDKIPVPDFWGGLRIVPDRIEFWQGRESRLHDRFEYVRDGDGKGWKLQRLSP